MIAFEIQRYLLCQEQHILVQCTTPYKTILLIVIVCSVWNVYKLALLAAAIVSHVEGR